MSADLSNQNKSASGDTFAGDKLERKNDILEKYMPSLSVRTAFFKHR